MRILDCTLRDGGYYNGWDFSPEIVESYLDSMAKANIDYVELGLRSFPKSGFYGSFAYTTESFVNRLHLPVGPTYGVMIDAATILNSRFNVKDAIDFLFPKEKESKISLVRIAAHFHEVEQSGLIVKALKDKGYIIGLNLMQASGKPCSEISLKAKLVNTWGLNVLYFADSIGNMDAKEVTRIVKALRVHWNGDLGIHTHNNMSKALDNTLVANKLGVTWLDSTVTGMGRGAGNAQTEYLLAVLSQTNERYNPAPIYEIVIRYFEKMQKNYRWGGNLLYFLGAQNDVHPTYIQNLLSDTHYGTDEIVGAIEYLSKIDGTSSYNDDILLSALSFNNTANPITGSNELKNIFSNREVLIVGNGPSLKWHKLEIEAYIEERKPIVLAVNINNTLSEVLIDYYCVSHNSKFLSESNVYIELNKPIILPSHLFSNQQLEAISKKGTLHNYGLKVIKNEFNVSDTFCVVPYEVTAAYALALASHTNASSISLVGFDGYERGDSRQNEMLEIIDLFKKIAPLKTLISLTPTSYPVEKSSIYAPVS